MGRTALALAAGMWLSVAVARAEPSPAPERDWVVANLEKGVLETGRIGWDGFGVGTWIHHRMSVNRKGVPMGVLVGGETRETLVARDERGTTIRFETRMDGPTEWTGADRFLARQRIPGGTLATKELGSEELVVEGIKTPCAKAEWACVVDGKPVRTLTIWRDGAGRPARWVKDDGDSWTVTHEVLRWSVPHKAGERTFDCREIRRKATSTLQAGAEFAATELWTPAVPDFVVRSETTRTEARGAPKDVAASTTQVRELAGFEAK